MSAGCAHQLVVLCTVRLDVGAARASLSAQTGNAVSKISRRRFTPAYAQFQPAPQPSAIGFPANQQQQQQRRTANIYIHTADVRRRKGCLDLCAAKQVSVVDQARIIGSRSLVLTCPTRQIAFVSYLVHIPTYLYAYQATSSVIHSTIACCYPPSRAPVYL